VSFDDPHDRLRQLVEPTRRGISDFERGRARKLGLGLLLGLLPRMSLVLVIGYWGLVLISGREPFSPFVLPALLALALLAGFAALWMRAQRIEASPARAAARVDREFDLQGRSAAGLEFSKDPAEDLPRRVRAFRRLAVEDALAHAGRVQGAAAAIRRGVPPLPWRLALFALLLSFVPSVLRLDAAKTVPHSDQHPPKAGAFESGASKSDEAAKELVTEREHETAHRRSEAGKPEALSEHKPDAPNESGSSKKARPSSAQAPLVAADAASSQSIASPSESSESSASRSSGSQGASAGGGSAKSGKRPEGEAEEERTAKKRKSPRPRQPKGAETKKGESDASGAVPRGSSTSGGRLAAVGNKRSGVDRGEEREDDAETEDEEIEDEQEESDQRGGVMPRMRDRRASPSRDLSISGDGPPDDGRGGPSPPKKARGTASLVLGVRLPDVVDGVLTCLFAGGNVLLEGVPGIGKTLLVRTLAQALTSTSAASSSRPT
jgi:hypothetical protein